MIPLRCAATAVAAVVPWVAAGCAASSEREIILRAVEPAAAHNDVPITLTIRGDAFRPAYRIDSVASSAGVAPGAYATRLLAAANGASAARARVSATAVSWQGAGVLVAHFPAKIAAGNYDLEVVDPRGAVKVLAPAFVSLGPDNLLPSITIYEPADRSVLAAETTVTGIVQASDGAGHLVALDWTVSGPDGGLAAGMCVIPKDVHEAPCTFSFATPRPAGATDALVLAVKAQDAAGNKATVRASLDLAPRPYVTGFTPSAGPTLGGTSLAVQGGNFVAGNPGTQILMNGVPIQTVFVGETLLQGFTPEHEHGSVAVTVRTGGASTSVGRFSFVAAPIVRAISPSLGSSAGGTRVTVVGNHFRAETEIRFDDAALVCPRLISESRVEGLAPAGAGIVSVTGIDPIGGDGQLGTEFAFSDGIAGGLPPPGSCPDSGGGSPP